MAFQQKVLKECSKILLEIENTNNPENTMDSRAFDEILSQRYMKYKQRKQSKNEECLPLHEFVALCSITADRNTDKPFLFEKTKLSFTIMCSNCDMNHEPMVTLKQFKKWATKLYPLATKQNYKRIFLALASTDCNSDVDDVHSNDGTNDTTDGRRGSFGRLRQRMAEYTQSNKLKSGSSSSLKRMNTSKHDKSVYGGITMHRFCGYVDELITSFNIEQNECAGIKSSLETHLRSMSERILYHIRGVSDISGLPPYYGFVILTDCHLIFQGTALTTRTTCIKLSDASLDISRSKIGFLKRDTALRVCCSTGTFTWNVVNIKSLRRDQLYWSIWSMLRAHELAENVRVILNKDYDPKVSDEMIMKIKRKIVVEAADDVLRQNSLENLLGKEDKFGAIPFVRYATLDDKKEYVCRIRDELNERGFKQNASKSVMTSIFTGIIKKKTDNINKTLSKTYIDPDDEMECRKHHKFESDFERENKLANLNKIQSEKREEFDLREFFKYIKILRIEFEPLVFIHRMYLCIILWKNVGLSLLIFIFLELVAYADLVKYIPAILLILNGILLISLRNDMEYTVQCFDSALIFAGFDPDDFDQEKQAALKYAQRESGMRQNKPKSKWGIMHKIKAARYQFYYNRFSLGFHQKKLAVLSDWLGRFRTIYKWHKVEKSQIACLMSIFCGFICMIVSARYVFAVIVFVLFFKNSPFRSERSIKKKGIIDGYFESIPPDIPDVDSDDQSESDDQMLSDNDDDSEILNNNNNNNDKITMIKNKMNNMKKNISGGSAGQRSSDDTDTQ